MAKIPVNPPPQLKLPSAFAKDPEIRAYYKNFDRFMLQLWTRTGGGEDLVEVGATNFNVSFASEIDQIQKRLGSGIPVTIDTTGFTVDNTFQTTDRTEQ